MRASWWATVAAAVLLAGACRTPDPGEADDDGDGFIASEDCNDGDAAINPDAVEVCDEIDNNCDGFTDEGVTKTYFADLDADTYGDAESPVQACELGDNLASNSLDCDDNDANTNPYAPEVCDERDNNCNARVDEGVTSTFYTDADGDGYGDLQAPLQACWEDVGRVANADDCDDALPAVNPDATERCNGIDDDCDDIIDEDDAIDALTWYVDADGDSYGNPSGTRFACTQPAGYVSNDDDCDDAHDNAYPGATEYCDDLDNDCDGIEDEDDAVDAATWYYDGDGDDYGVDATATNLVQCEDPGTTYVSVADDCDDARSDVNPSELEICDGSTDEDCDGTVDEDTASDASTWYADSDGDGFGNPYSTTAACEQPTGYLADATDCDDTDEDINPDALEICDGSTDENCDGTIDEDTASDASTWYLDGDADGYGDVTSTTVACSAPTGYVGDNTDCDDADSTSYPGADEVCDSADNDCDTAVDEDPVSGGTWYYADSDGDGYGDTSYSDYECAAPSGYVDNDDDCDDADASLNPDTYWYRDYDRDGYGESTASYQQCADPSYSTVVYLQDDTDCNDYDATIYPGATEVCVNGSYADGVDDDCDGSIDEGCPEIHCGTIAADETWSNTTDHLVTCNTYVQASSSPLLTIEDGTWVEFSSRAGLWVGYSYGGDIDVQGTSTGVTMTSNATSPGAGDWYGLLINSNGTSSSIEGLDISYGGYSSSYPANIYLQTNSTSITDSASTYSGYHGIYVYNGEPEITGTTLAYNDGNGLYCPDTYYYKCLDPTDGSFADNLVAYNGGYPVVLPATQADYLDTSSSYSGNGTDQIYLYQGTLTDNATWHDLGVPYLVSGNVYVQDNSNSPVLTLEAGVELDFSAARGLWVGWSYAGDIEIAGTASNPVLLTSARATPSAGDWYGLLIGANASGSTTYLDNATVEYGGYSTSYPGNLYLYGVTGVSVTDSTFEYSGRHGVYVGYNASGEFTGSTFANNSQYGLYLYTYSSYSGGLDDSFADNVVTANNAPVFMDSRWAHLLDASSTYSGNTSDYVVLDYGGYIDANVTWQDIGVPYHSTNNLYVGNASTGASLTLEDGVDVVFASNRAMYVGWGSTAGDLIIQGDRALGDGVTLESYSGGGPGTWYGVLLGSGTSAGTTMAGFELRDAGGSASYPGGLYLTYGTATLSDCLVEANEQNGIHLSGLNSTQHSTLDISDCTVQDNVAAGSYDGSGIYLTYYTSSTAYAHELTMDTVEITGNEGYPVVVHANNMIDLDDASTYSGNDIDRAYVHGGYVDTSGTWLALDVPYEINDNIVIQKTGSGVLIEGDALEVYMALYKGIYAGYSGPGDLILTDSTVTSNRSSGGLAGDWCGLYFGSYSSSLSELDGDTIEYAGRNTSCMYNSYPGNVRLNSASATITNNTISDSSSYGVYCQSSTSATVSGNVYSGIATADEYGC